MIGLLNGKHTLDYRAIFFTQIGSPCGTLLQSQSGPKPAVTAAKPGNRM
jgi:hypothetical protein